MKYHFFIEDNIWFLRDLNRDRPASVFEHPYLAMLKNLHEKYGTKVQLDLFYSTDDFNLSEMTDAYKNEFIANSDWLCFGFHSRSEWPAEIYKDATYDEVYEDCTAIHREIKRFAGEESLSLYTSVHFASISEEGKRALRDCGIKGMIDLFAFGGPDELAYGVRFDAEKEPYTYDEKTGFYYYYNDMIINLYKLDEIEDYVAKIPLKPLTLVMIHEQYFFPFYKAYQPDYADKLDLVMKLLAERGAESVLLADITE